MHHPNLLEALRTRAQTTPSKCAIRWRGAPLTYLELERHSNQVARALQVERTGPGTRVAVLSKNSPAQLEVWLGAMKSQVVLVPLNYRLIARELIYILDHAEAEILFVGRDHYEVAQSMLAQLPRLRLVIAIDGDHPAWDSLGQWRARHDAAPLPVAASPDDVALQIYTSGTTGRPKGVELCHRNVLADLARVSAHDLWHDTDVILMCMPMCHFGGCSISMRCLHFGMEMVLMDGFEAGTVINALEENRVTKAVFVPPMLNMMLAHPAIAEADLSALDLVFYGAGVMPYELLTRCMQVFRTRFATGYGMTETCGAVTHLGPEDHVGPLAPERMKSCGKADGSIVRVVDELGGDVDLGTVGEVVCRSPQVMRGYFKQPEETAITLRNGWMHTGDAGYFDADGYLYISDRIKDMIKSGGINVYPREIEEVLLEHPAISEVAVIGVPHPRWDEAVKAIVCLRPGQVLTAEELIAFSRERMAPFKVPQSVDFVDRLPRSATDKVLKRELRRPYWEGRARQV